MRRSTVLRVMRAGLLAGSLVVLCGTTAVTAGTLPSKSICGRIVAFRAAERISQVVSGVVNQETFLLRIDRKPVEIVKIFYEHDGYSEIAGNANLSLEVRPDPSCDANYGQFVSEAPVLTSEDKTDSIPAVSMVGEFKGLRPEYKLKCYRLGPGHIRVKETNP